MAQSRGTQSSRGSSSGTGSGSAVSSSQVNNEEYALSTVGMADIEVDDAPRELQLQHAIARNSSLVRWTDQADQGTAIAAAGGHRLVRPDDVDDAILRKL
jgi:hypothetical protein